MNPPVERVQREFHALVRHPATVVGTDKKVVAGGDPLAVLAYRIGFTIDDKHRIFAQSQPGDMRHHRLQSVQLRRGLLNGHRARGVHAVCGTQLQT